MTGQPLIEGLAAPARVVLAYLEAERVEGGFLEDVETLIPTIKHEGSKDPPAVWIHEHPTVVDTGQSPNLSHTQYMNTPFEFVCVEYDPDIVVAAEMSRNLATRVGASILKNFNLVKSQPLDPNRIFQTIRFNQFVPDGEASVDIQGKSDKIPASAIIFEFIYPIQWMLCNRI